MRSTYGTVIILFLLCQFGAAEIMSNALLEKMSSPEESSEGRNLLRIKKICSFIRRKKIINIRHMFVSFLSSKISK